MHRIGVQGLEASGIACHGVLRRSGYHSWRMLRSSRSAFHPDSAFAVPLLHPETSSTCRRTPSGSRRLTGLLVTAATLFLACAPREAEPEDPEFTFASAARMHTRNLTTDLISVPENVGLAAIDRSWQVSGAPGSEQAWLSVAEDSGRLRIFSADGDLETIELELALGNATGRKRLAVYLQLNDQQIDRLHIEADWGRYQIAVPASLVQRGVNFLTMATRKRHRQNPATAGPDIRLRRARFQSRSGRPPWPSRPDTIRVDDTVQMPVASFIDWVVEVPTGARLQGSWEFQAPEEPALPSWTYIQILDESQSERTLFHKRLYRTTRSTKPLDMDMSAWTGQQVRLRVGTAGARNGIVKWHTLSLRIPIDQPQS